MEFNTRYQNVKSITLADNFRSSEGIVQTARQVIERNSNRIRKEMQSQYTQSYEKGDILALIFDTPEDEASWIADKINNLLGTTYSDKQGEAKRGLSYSDFAILLRSVKNDAEQVVNALKANDIPFIVKGMNALFNTNEVLAMCNVFYFLNGEHPQTKNPITENYLIEILQEAQLGLKPSQIQNGIEFLKQRKSLIDQNHNEKLYLQRVYIDFLESIELREEGTPNGEVVYYNLGKFSQIISDFEQIYFNSKPQSLYQDFARFLFHTAPEYYPEGWLDSNYATPNAVQIMTVHQAKGLQWAGVFIPCLRRNRFPARGQGGRNIWHVIPESSVKNSARYKGSTDDERRLFYVAITRAEKYLFCTYSPILNNRMYKKPSEFFNDFTQSEYVLTRDLTNRQYEKIVPKSRENEINVTFTFSELKYYFECPYMFKLKFLYGFNPPIEKAIGYGKSLHDALSEIHSQSIRSNVPTLEDIPRLLDTHLHLPFADSIIEENLRKGAEKALARYLRDHGKDLDLLEHAEKVIELKLADGIVVNGRIDLIRRTDTKEIVIVDFKSNERTQSEEITLKQLQIYSLGYQQLTGTNADLIEVHNLEVGRIDRDIVKQDIISQTTTEIIDAGNNLRKNNMPRLTDWSDKCARCDVVAVCRKRE